MAVQTSVEGFAVRNRLLADPFVEGVQMAVLAIRLRGLHQRRIAGLDRMDAGFEYVNHLPVGEIFIGKGRFDVADIGAVDFLGDRIVGKFFDVCMAFPASHLAVEAV